MPIDEEEADENAAAGTETTESAEGNKIEVENPDTLTGTFNLWK